MKPQHVADIHRGLCAKANCPHLDKINYMDPCRGCPLGHFPPYQRSGCEKQEKPPRYKKPRPQKRPAPRPGDILALVIKKVTGEAAGCGPCSVWVKKMNDWGWRECWHHRGEIIDRLIEEAARRGHTITKRKMWSLFAAAWKEARK
jgi:hypothetical protein